MRVIELLDGKILPELLSREREGESEEKHEGGIDAGVEVKGGTFKN